MYLLKVGCPVNVCFIKNTGHHISERVEILTEVSMLIEDKYVIRSGDYPGELFCIFDSKVRK